MTHLTSLTRTHNKDRLGSIILLDFGSVDRHIDSVESVEITCSRMSLCMSGIPLARLHRRSDRQGRHGIRFCFFQGKYSGRNGDQLGANAVSFRSRLVPADPSSLTGANLGVYGGSLMRTEVSYTYLGSDDPAFLFSSTLSAYNFRRTPASK
jgi:hypothetical protein